MSRKAHQMVNKTISIKFKIIRAKYSWAFHSGHRARPDPSSLESDIVSADSKSSAGVSTASVLNEQHCLVQVCLTDIHCQKVDFYNSSLEE